MRLIAGKVRRLEARAAAAAEAPGEVGGLCWSSAESRIDPDQLKAGETIAVDCFVDAWPVNETMPVEWRTVERVTSDREDLGRVYGPGGELCGRVVERRRGGRLVRIDWERGPLVAGAGSA